MDAGEPPSRHPLGGRFGALECAHCLSGDVLILSASYEGWLNGNSEGEVEYVCRRCERFTRHWYRD
jgi:hypothetical protein